MNVKSIALFVAVLLVVLAVVSLVFRLLAGLASGAFNLILGVVVIVGLVAIVAWMFAYAKKKRK
ncbi:MAG: hypothetical protein Q4E38_05875 [Eubacteriales bacterium]|nr:hypothetical protein [Eubacteriales bacterium]